jgi:transcriptional regulator with XRE-family HTH domain
MPKRPLESLGATVRQKRGDRKLRETAQQIGIGTATLMRVESGRTPDVATFGRLCNWLKIDPAEFLGYEKGIRQSSLPTITAHFKADRTPKEETIRALAEMVLTLINTQPGLPDPKDAK